MSSAEVQNQRDQFNAQNRLVIDQSNAQWRREISTANTAAINRANEFNATKAMEVTMVEYNNTKSLSKVSVNEFVNNFKKAPLGNRTSNYFNVELLNQLDKLSNKDKDKFISELVGYASSNSSFSSIFTKVS